MRNQTSVRWVCVFRDIREMRVCKQEVSVVPKWKWEIGLLVNISKHGATASKPHLASLIQASVTTITAVLFKMLLLLPYNMY
jgi:hypothetical protein